MSCGRFQVVLLGAALLIPLGSSGQQLTPAEFADQFESGGLQVFRVQSMPCTSDNPYFAELLRRDLTDQRTGELASSLGMGGGDLCADTGFDDWIVSELIERFSHDDRPSPSCTVDCGNVLASSAELALWNALERREPDDAVERWLRLAEAAPSPPLRSHALLAGVRRMEPVDRIDLYLRMAEGSTFPEDFATMQALLFTTQHPELLFERVPPQRMITLPDAASEALLSHIRLVADGLNPVSPEAEELAREYLLEVSVLRQR